MKNKRISLILIFLFVVPFLSLSEGGGETQVVIAETAEALEDDLDWIAALSGGPYMGGVDWIAALSGEPYTGLKCEWFPDCKEEYRKNKGAFFLKKEVFNNFRQF